MTRPIRHLGDLRPDQRNARRHNPRNIGLVEKSLQADGFGRSILLDAAGNILAGNGVTEAAGNVGLEDVIVVPSDGTKVIAIQRTDVEPDSERAIRLAIADNRAQDLSDFDPAVVAALAEEVDLSDFWREDELDALIAEADAQQGTAPVDAPEAQMDHADALLAKWRVRHGDVWQIGAHQLLCEDAQRVAGSFAADCPTLVFDPEWDDAVPTPEGFTSVLAFGDGSTVGDITTRFGAPQWVFAWDCVTSWYTPNRPLRRMKLACWYGDLTAYDFDGWHYGDAGKPHVVSNTRGSYEYVPDARGKHLSDVYSEPITDAHADGLHSHSKPIDWVTLLIGNCTRGNVYDPYAGSGTTLVACERLGRICRAVEIEPRYVAVILERFADMGINPQRVGVT